MTLCLYQGNARHFMEESPEMENKVIVIGCNTGMASGDEALRRSWKKDIASLLEHRLLTFFTCANDHNDLKCERALMSELRARFVLPPRKNPFQAVTVLHPPGQQETGWYSANAFIYAVQVSEST